MTPRSSEAADALADGPLLPEAELTVTHPFVLRLLTILWPAFLMAGVLEMLTFVVVDPAELRWFGGELLGWSASSIYTVTFLIYWGVVSVSNALTALLSGEESDRSLHTHRRPGTRWP